MTGIAVAAATIPAASAVPVAWRTMSGSATATIELPRIDSREDAR